ncbi:MAG: helix-turn-helix transcriptional regulator [Gemmatimonadales bacterium]|nr:helix-turn-helix transcriptional regulator [Gemmatimonadales bacterium]
MPETIHPLREWREARGLTQAQLAKMLGCSQMMVSKIEAWERRPGGELARVMDEVTDGYVSRRWSRPDIFGPLTLKAS